MPKVKNSELPKNIVNPFSEAFLDKWQLWKDYRWEEHKFKYKGVISEQARLMELVTLSGNNEDTAIKILMQSIENTWTGFYPLKNKSSNGNYGTRSFEQRPISIKAEVNTSGNFGNL